MKTFIQCSYIEGSKHFLDSLSLVAIALSGALIFTTIQAQDFPDVDGDIASGRVTFPILAPEFSRIFTLIAIIGWSVGLGWFWGIGPRCGCFFVMLGSSVGCRYYWWRTPQHDRWSYQLFNVSFPFLRSLYLSIDAHIVTHSSGSSVHTFYQQMPERLSSPFSN